MLSGDVELDDFYLSARDRPGEGRQGRGTNEQAMVVAVERCEASVGRCAVRVVPDCSGATYGKFAGQHLDRTSHVLADGWKGISGGLRGWPGLDQRKFDAQDKDARLPTVHHVISNFEAWVQGTFHGLATTRLQSYADEFSWRYSHRGRDATTALLADCCRGHYTRDELSTSVFLPQPVPKKPPKRPRGRPRKAA